MKSTQLILITIAITLFGCSQNQVQEKPDVQEEPNKFSGLWSLHIIEQKDSVTGAWNEWRNGMQGYILYDDRDNMSVHLTTKDYEDFDLQFPNFVDSISTEALKHLTNSYVYFAKYTVDEQENTVEHARISHSNPGEWNDVVKRRFTFSGDTLILQPVEQQNASLRLKWVKASLN